MEPKKQLFLQTTRPEACLFKLMQELGEPEAACAAHCGSKPKKRQKTSAEPRTCPIPSCQVWTCGFSCKNFSRANSKWQGSRLTLLSQERLSLISTPCAARSTPCLLH